MRRLPATIWLPALVVAIAGCTERALLEVDPETAPGQKTLTEEIEIPVQGLLSWRDTTYSGYVLPSSSSYRVVVDSVDQQSRLLARFETIPDSIETPTGREAIEAFANGRIRVIIDTTISHVPSAGLDLEVYTLTRGYDRELTTWTLAEKDVPWTTPGADLGRRIASLTIDAPFDSTVSDTVFVPFVASTDSVLSAWRATDGQPGLAVVASGATSFLQVRSIALLFDAKPEQQDTLIAGVRGAAGFTVIFSPETPDPGQTSRLAGLPSSRIYLDFELPDSWQELQLKGSMINTASLVFRPGPPAPIPFLLEYPLEITAFRLLADPFVVGPKTPIGATLGPNVLLDPATMTEDGAELVLSITPLVRAWSFAPADSITVLRVGVQALPEGRDPGFWRFGSAEDIQALRPSVRMLVTPTVPFRLP
ncbi:MAG: hypothetical protein JJE01_11265 [Gemmatimonadetes bacterium]|nr:hypothetical protein [Gemmatimonadota bacterium]